MSVHFFISTYFLCLILVVERMRSYKNNRVNANSFACSTGTSTLSYDQPAQCYCQLLSRNGSKGPSSMIVHSTSRIMVSLSAIYSPKLTVFLESSISTFLSTYCALKWCRYWSQWICGSTSQSHTGRPLKSGWCHKPLSYKCTIFYKRIFPYRSDL